jgi:ABC-type antimicrobial peptide transport system permease subunit
MEAVIDFNIAGQYDIGVGELITIRTVEGDREEFQQVTVVGISEGQQFLYAPSIFLPYRTWDQIRPTGGRGMRLVDPTANIIAVKIAPGYSPETVSANLITQVKGIEVADIKTAYEALPGYSVQQTTLNTQSFFTLLIGMLVIGGFFQIQLLQKVPQIGVLKAIGTSNLIVAASVVLQIILVTTFGVLMGGVVTLLLAAGIPGTVPVVFSGNSVAIAIAALLAIGPIGGLVSVRLAINVEPLLALGLSS